MGEFHFRSSQLSVRTPFCLAFVFFPMLQPDQYLQGWHAYAVKHGRRLVGESCNYFGVFLPEELVASVGVARRSACANSHIAHYHLQDTCGAARVHCRRNG